MDALLHITLFVILAIATVTDLRERRIPNRLTYPAMLLAIAWHAALSGPPGMLHSVSGLGVGLGAMLAPYLMGVMGAGDVKLMAAVGAFLGPAGALAAFVCATLAGGVYALGVLVFHTAALRRVAAAMRDSVGLLAVTGRFVYTPQTEGLPQLAYGAAIAVGTVASLLYLHGPAAFVPSGWM
jgi:prepilin peptidase CpaA